jgi:ornithine carbamoyltransferase
MYKDYIVGDEIAGSELKNLLADAEIMKNELARGRSDNGENAPLKGMNIALIFEKPSTRTRVSFEVGLSQLGAHTVVLSGRDMQLGRGETIEDTGKVLSRYCDAIVIRTYEQEKLEALAEASAVPVVNALSDTYHPCQALADLLTIKEEKRDFEDLKLVYLGDGNNVCHSLLLAAAMTGMNMVAACPPEFAPNPVIIKYAQRLAKNTGARISLNDNAVEAADNADVLYTDVWVSMGDEDSREKRLEALNPYKINEEIVAVANLDAIVMHCLPAHRGEEIEASILDGPHSVVFKQAENRLHAQKALMVKLLKEAAGR